MPAFLSTKWRFTGKVAWTQTNQEPSISDEEWKAYWVAYGKMREPWSMLVGRSHTVLFDGRDTDMKKEFPDGKREITGHVPTGHLLTLSVSNISEQPKDFAALVRVDLV